MKLYKKFIAEPNSVSVNYTTFPAHNPLHLHFRQNILETMKKVAMTIDGKIYDTIFSEK